MGNPQMQICPTCKQKSLFFNESNNLYKCLNPKCVDYLLPLSKITVDSYNQKVADNKTGLDISKIETEEGFYNQYYYAKKPSWIKTKIGRIGLSVLFLGALTTGIYEAYQHDLIPIHQTIDVPSSFNNDTLDTQYIKAGINTVAISADETQTLLKDSIKPFVKNENPDVSIFFPVDLSNGQTVRESTPLENLDNWQTGELEPTSTIRYLVIPAKGTPLTFLFPENTQVFQLHRWSTPGVRNSYFFDGLLFRIPVPNSDQTIELLINQDYYNSQQLLPAEILNKAPLMEGDEGFYLPGSNLNPEQQGLILPSQKITLMMTAKKNVTLQIMSGILAGNFFNESKSPVVPFKIKFFTQNGKIAIP
jgi:hypothetical protein